MRAPRSNIFETAALRTHVAGMRMKITGLLLLACFAALFAGCSSPFSTRKAMPLDGFRRIYVEKRLNDNNHFDEILAAELRRLGYEASHGHLTMMPANTDAVLTYDARWVWDFKTYLIECNLELRTTYTNKKLADARYYRPSMRTSSAEEIARDLLGPLFAPTK